jgi:hypothetical protein
MKEVGMPATVAIDPPRILGTVDRRIFGGFVEHLGRSRRAPRNPGST